MKGYRRPRQLGEASASDFIPDRELYLVGDGALEYAYGRLCCALMELVRKYVIGDGAIGESVQERMAMIHELTNPVRLRDPIGTIKVLAQRRDEWFTRVERLRAEHNEAVEWLKQSPTTAISLDALGVYQQYVVALVRMKLMKRPNDDEMGFLSDAELAAMVIDPDENVAYADAMGKGE